MKDKLVLQGKLEIKNAHIVIDGVDLANVLEHGSSVFMVVEPLPESKPEQPKPAEPQGWEQRLKTQFPDAYGEGPLMAFIRAEIDRAWGDGFKAGHDIAEENRSNE